MRSGWIAEWVSQDIELQSHHKHVCMAKAIDSQHQNVDGYSELLGNPQSSGRACGRLVNKVG